MAEENFSDCLRALLRGHFRARSYCRMAGGRVLTTARGHLVVPAAASFSRPPFMLRAARLMAAAMATTGTVGNVGWRPLCERALRLFLVSVHTASTRHPACAMRRAKRILAVGRTFKVCPAVV